MSTFEPLFTMFNKAAKTLIFPRITLYHNDQTIKLVRCGNDSRYTGQINVTVDGEWIGRIASDGNMYSFRLAVLTEQNIAERWRSAFNHVLQFAANPKEQAAIHGHKHGNCCFCCRDLTNAVSVHLGYGPICAEKYGLPHSIETVTDNVDMNSLDALLVDE